MNIFNPTFPFAVAVLLMFAPFASVAGPDPAGSQQGAEIEWIPVSRQGEELFFMAQRTPGARLLLTPNESFFPSRGLWAQGDCEVPEAERAINGGTRYKMITQWDPGDQAEWGLWFEKTGTVQIRIWMAHTGKEGRYTLLLGNQKRSFSTEKTGDDPEPVKTLTFNVRKPGQYLLRLTCEEESKRSPSQLHAIEIAGSAARNAAVLRKRWRPAAAHAKFYSSHDPEGVRLCIMEMDAKPGSLGFYAPLTTPFGYYGPVWTASGLVNTGFNFSLWSFSANQEEPSIERLSHLIAIGDPDALFSGFSHEGTGVKIRGWEPLEGRQGQRQVFAIRMEPGETYTTYTTYFFANDEKRWCLFGVGKTYNKHKPRQTLGIGSFVEVPGPPRVQRTGPYERRMRYRGWVVDEKGKLHPYDRMSDGDIDKKTGMTQTRRGITKDGWFYLQTGGWTFQKKEKPEAIALPRPDKRRIAYLDPSDLKYLQTVPSAITGTEVKFSGNRATLSFNIRNLGKNSEVKVYWGEDEGLTFPDRWANHIDMKNPCEGGNTIELDSVGKSLRVRLLLKNHEGQFWSMDTLVATPRS